MPQFAKSEMIFQDQRNKYEMRKNSSDTKFYYQNFTALYVFSESQ